MLAMTSAHRAPNSALPDCRRAIRGFLQAADEGCAPKVHLEATHQRALDIVPLNILQAHALRPDGGED